MPPIAKQPVGAAFNGSAKGNTGINSSISGGAASPKPPGGLQLGGGSSYGLSKASNVGNSPENPSTTQYNGKTDGLASPGKAGSSPQITDNSTNVTINVNGQPTTSKDSATEKGTQPTYGTAKDGVETPKNGKDPQGEETASKDDLGIGDFVKNVTGAIKDKIKNSLAEASDKIKDSLNKDDKTDNAKSGNAQPNDNPPSGGNSTPLDIGELFNQIVGKTQTLPNNSPDPIGLSASLPPNPIGSNLPGIGNGNNTIQPTFLPAGSGNNNSRFSEVDAGPTGSSTNSIITINQQTGSQYTPI